MDILNFKSFISEEVETHSFVSLFQKVINDEISATILYLRLANELDGAINDYFRDQMEEHAEDEYGHFKDLIDIASNRGIPFTVQLTSDANIAIDIENSEALIALTQELETIAIDDYKKLIGMASNMKEFDMHRKFREILNDEAEHFDDVAVITGETRPIG